MGIIKLMLEDNNNKLLEMICSSITTRDEKLSEEIQPGQRSRTICTIKFGNEIAVRCFLRDKRYVALVLNSVTNNLVLYKGIVKEEGKYWESTNHYKTFYNLISLDDTEVLEDLIHAIDKMLTEPDIEYYVPPVTENK